MAKSLEGETGDATIAVYGNSFGMLKEQEVGSKTADSKSALDR
ncbi:hypothetical protein MAXJ12_35821 [Mesorhizobium alhagi CCNWXJ12-2]|uniref:Uncharacterized protein n=1 Tax=Mesorhizobium alhagi CCNWXJ12-2 TaxID=1107882 RepID=H0I3U7_9HYPH|nr:hypothetical protein MAXJ12_35821 [Mesorhizobium alhagi CCNWXJ12-2]